MYPASVPFVEDLNLVPEPPCFLSIQAYHDRFVANSFLFPEYRYYRILFDDKLTPQLIRYLQITYKQTLHQFTRA
jgi:hypothetical protein